MNLIIEVVVTDRFHCINFSYWSVSVQYNQHVGKIRHFPPEPWKITITETSQWAWWRLKSPGSRLFTKLVFSTVSSGADQRKYQSCASLAFVGEFTGDRWIPAQMASSAENVSIWCRHHAYSPNISQSKCRPLQSRVSVRETGVL